MAPSEEEATPQSLGSPGQIWFGSGVGSLGEVSGGFGGRLREADLLQRDSMVFSGAAQHADIR